MIWGLQLAAAEAGGDCLAGIGGAEAGLSYLDLVINLLQVTNKICRYRGVYCSDLAKDL